MVRKHIYFDELQLHFLESLPGTSAEHVRQALDEYIEKKKREQLNVSTSPSTIMFDYVKGGKNDGRI